MDLRQAVQRAGELLPEVFPEAASKKLHMEGFERTETEDGLFWKLTFSFDTDQEPSHGLFARDYKTVNFAIGMESSSELNLGWH